MILVDRERHFGIHPRPTSITCIIVDRVHWILGCTSVFAWSSAMSIHKQYGVSFVRHPLDSNWDRPLQTVSSFWRSRPLGWYSFKILSWVSCPDPRGRFLKIRFVVRLTFSLQKAAKKFGERRNNNFLIELSLWTSLSEKRTRNWPLVSRLPDQ